MENSRFEFRAWNKETKIMMDPHKLTPLALHPELNVNGVFLPFHPDIILIQFTGLLDRKGKKIFEGDKLLWPDGDIHEVVYNAPSFYAGYASEDYPWEESEIIGNIYENPELLK